MVQSPQASTGAASSGHRGPGDPQVTPAAAAGQTQQPYDAATAVAPPYAGDAEDAQQSPRTAAAAQKPPGIAQEAEQLPQWQRRKRSAEDQPAPMTPTRPAHPSLRLPREKESGPEARYIGTPSDPEAGENSPLNNETNEDSPIYVDPKLDDQNVMDKLAEVMLAINNSMTLMAQRLSTLEGSRATATTSATEALPAIHYKDVDKPPKYDGKNWTVWSSDFLTFLDRRDKRWSKLLKAIDKRSLNPLTEGIKVRIADELAINSGTLVEDFTNQLYEYLKNYTSGEVQSCVVSAGREGSWGSWRVMCDHGRSRRKIEVHEDYKRLMNPSQVPLENLLKTIAAWERDLLNYTMNNDDKGLPEDTKILCLESMCPEALQEHLLDRFEQGFIETYDEYKQAINTYVYRRTKKKPSKKLCSLYSESAQCSVDNCDQCEYHEEEDPEFDQQILALKQQADAINGQLNALVKDKFGKTKGKGKGKGDKGGTARSPGGASPMQVDHSGKDCYACGEIGHIAANCPNGGKGNGNFPAGTKGDKSKGKGSKGDKGKGKGKGGKGPWHPTLQNWKQWYPGPSPTQWTEWWKQASPNATYKSAANLFEQGQRLSSLQQPQDWWGGEPQAPTSQQVLGALFASGNMYSLVEKGPKAKAVAVKKEVSTQNRFSGLESDAADENILNSHKPKVTTEAPLNAFLKPPSRNRQRKDVPRTSADGQANALLEFTKKSHGSLIDEMGLKVLSKQSLKVFRENSTAPVKLAAVKHRENPKAANGWEVISCVVDSGATITAIHPNDGKAYSVEENENSRNGVTYETAGTEDLDNLGEKKMAVLTAEGTLRGFHSQVARVSSPLESVRQLLGNKHCVLFGLGESEDEHLIVNKVTGEVNWMRDDGTNYLHDMLVVPPDEVHKVQQCLNEGVSPFGGQGTAR